MSKVSNYAFSHRQPVTTNLSNSMVKADRGNKPRELPAATPGLVCSQPLVLAQVAGRAEHSRMWENQHKSRIICTHYPNLIFFSKCSTTRRTNND